MVTKATVLVLNRNSQAINDHILGRVRSCQMFIVCSQHIEQLDIARL